MHSRSKLTRSLVEIVLAIAMTEAAVMYLLPVVAPGLSQGAEALLDALMVASVATPFILWRLSHASKAEVGDFPDLQQTGVARTSLAITVVLMLGTGATVLATHGASSQVSDEAQARFDRLSDRLTSEVERRVNQVRYGLAGARGTFAAMGELNRGAFARYVASRDLPGEFPGAIGFGFIERVQRTELAEFIARETEDDAPDFRVHGLAAPDSPLATLPDLFVIKYCFPKARNASAWGLDVGSERERRQAAERAVDTGEPAISGRIELVQDGRKQTAFLYYLPVYRPGSDPGTQDERREALVGLLYAPIILHEALGDIVSSVDDQLQLTILDEPSARESRWLYGMDENVRPASLKEDLAAGRLFSIRPIDVGGRKWTIIDRAAPEFMASVDRITPGFIGIAGLLLTLLAAGVTLSLLTGRARAVALAQEITSDLNEAKLAAEEAIRETAAFRATLDQHSIISVADRAQNIVDVNPSLSEISGYGEEELLGEDHRLLKSGFHPPEFWADVWAEIHAGRAWRGEICNRSKSGAIYWTDSIIAPFLDSNNNVEKFVSISNDITARKNAETALIRMSERLGLATEAAGIGIWEFDLSEKVLSWDDQMYRLYGTDEAKAGAPQEAWAAAIHPEDQQRIDREIAATISSGTSLETEFRITWPGGEVRHIKAMGAVHHDSSRRPARIIGTNWDITAQVLSAESLRKARSDAEVASRSKSAFLANMSHEIRTPLTAILGFADVLREEGADLEPERRAQAIETIHGAGTHLLTVINDILDLSKIEADKMTIEKIDTPLVTILHEVEDLMRQRAAGKGLALETALITPVPDRIMSDPTRLRQIVMNLVGNAIKFTEEGRVRVEARLDEREGEPHIVVEIQDTGTGMSEEQSSRLFQAFGQANDSVTRKFGGTGLGLTICRRLAGLMGGNVRLLKSAPGRGSTFEVDLPLERAPGARDVQHLEGVKEKILQGAKNAGGVRLEGRILLAEDGPDNQRLISLYLRKAGAEVELASDGKIALGKIQEAADAGRPFDLLLTDMQMPEMDGYALARTLRRKASTLPIVALTAHAMAEDRTRCLEAGCDDYASKPVNRAELLRTCARWLGEVGGHGALERPA
ncbi:Sensor protein EvgS precursor [Planctomycetes bacterium Poly30]|uniref:histidine kinase n=1 Tax=Saltatorellus ferox TaxID=2528018 RepID=A0A518EM12_9BACT|nr:Sensor protein EvgS precursor [Planctomycetes bacterium Poly30]